MDLGGHKIKSSVMKIKCSSRDHSRRSHAFNASTQPLPGVLILALDTLALPHIFPQSAVKQCGALEDAHPSFPCFQHPRLKIL